MSEKTDRETLIKRFMQESGMNRQSAKFAADVELGNLPDGDVIKKDNDPDEKR